jgi:hypothetical protein
MELRDYCMTGTDELLELLSKRNNAVSEYGYIYIDNGKSVLAVAHADVHRLIEGQLSFTQKNSEMGSDPLVYSPYLDDRLGIYVIFEKLPALGINMDILITTGEESGNSSAREFSQNCFKKYNWIVEFDRKDEDVVLYEYQNRDMEKSLIKVGFKIGLGSRSDISHMESFGVACFNVGIGFSHEHYSDCSADLAILDRQLERFERFFRKNTDRFFKNEAL